jgi:hypothetical protein
MKVTDPLSSHTPGVSEHGFVSFIEAFSRVFKIGIYYPQGHAVLDQAVSRYLQLLRVVFPTSATITLEIEKNQIILEKRVMPEKSASVKDLHKLLVGLGIRSIVVEKALSHQQLLQFVRSILAWRAQLESAKTFIKYNLADLPSSIKVTQEQYLVDKNAGGVAGADGGSTNRVGELCTALAQRGLDASQVEQCRKLVLDLSSSEKTKDSAFNKFPNATWSDIQDLLFKIVTAEPSLEGGSAVSNRGRDVNALASIFEGLGRNLANRNAKETINLLVSHLSNTSISQNTASEKETSPEEIPGRASEPQIDSTVADIKQFVNDNKIPIKILGNLSSTDHSEVLSIILQILYFDEDKKMVLTCERFLETVIVRALTSREWSVLIAGIQHFADINNRDRFERLLEVILHALRLSKNLSSIECILDLWAQMPLTHQSLLWPYAVNELLIVGIGEEKEHFAKLTEIVSHMYPERMRGLRSRLENLDAFRERRLAPVIFRSSFKHAYPLFAFLLETTLGTIVARKVIEELQRDPQDSYIEAIAPLLRVSTPGHMQLLGLYLGQAQNPPLPTSMRRTAGQIILDFLENISEEQKELPWLEKTILATADLQVEGTEAVLERIANERKFTLLPAWNRNCRKAAEDALHRITSRHVRRR